MRSSDDLIERLERSAEQSHCKRFELIRMAVERFLDESDATLVALAVDVGTDQVFTLDRQDFSIYRRHGDKPYRVLP